MALVVTAGGVYLTTTACNVHDAHDDNADMTNYGLIINADVDISVLNESSRVQAS